MADISPGRFPVEQSFTTVNFKVNTPAITSESVSGKVRRVGQGHSYYTFEVKCPTMTPEQAGKVMGFVATALGPIYSFEIILPLISYSVSPYAAVYTNTITSLGAIGYGARSVTVTNCGSNGVTVLKAGDYFKFNNHSKVYMCTADAVTQANGNATISFSGALVIDVPTGTHLTIDAVPFTVILEQDTNEYEVSYGGLTTMSLPMREVW